jgi:adenosylhomocysteine nucleosidase
MVEGKQVRRVGMLAPMHPELEPIVRKLGLEDERDGEQYRGRAGAVEVVAMLTTMGMAAGAAAARRMLELEVDLVMVVGIAGGVSQSSVTIGDVIMPEVVIERSTGRTLRPSWFHDHAPRGHLSCGDDLIVDQEMLDGMHDLGVIALDMETAAVAAVCEDAGVPWAVFRSISDYAGEGLVDQSLFAMTNPDGTADVEAVTRWLDANPDKLEVLTRLAHDSNLATEAASDAAIRACRSL